MKLIQIFYELYQSDLIALEGHEDDELHALDREIRLCFEDHDSVWLSWSSEPRQFCVGYKCTPHFRDHIDELIDMSNCSMWSRFLGKELTLTYREPEHQLLEISDGTDSIWCWAEGEVGSDVLHVSTQPPAGT